MDSCRDKWIIRLFLVNLTFVCEHDVDGYAIEFSIWFLRSMNKIEFTVLLGQTNVDDEFFRMHYYLQI